MNDRPEKYSDQAKECDRRTHRRQTLLSSAIHVFLRAPANRQLVVTPPQKFKRPYGIRTRPSSGCVLGDMRVLIIYAQTTRGLAQGRLRNQPTISNECSASIALVGFFVGFSNALSPLEEG